MRDYLDFQLRIRRIMPTLATTTVSTTYALGVVGSKWFFVSIIGFLTISDVSMTMTQNTCNRKENIFLQSINFCRTNDDQSLFYSTDLDLETETLTKSLLKWKLSSADRLLAQTFPIDPETRNFVRKVRNVLFSRTEMTPLKGPLQLVAWSDNALENLLDLDPEVTQTTEFIEAFSGSTYPWTGSPLTHRYGGHQFGMWADQLGDGRAHFLGEYENRLGDRWELQLKGSGKTPYSRQGDGRAIIRSSVREFLASEAMYHLGVPTSRCVSLIISKETVKRDLIYDGRVTNERTGVVLRLSPSWFRFGSFEILARHDEILLLRDLADFVINLYFPDISSSLLDSSRYLALFSDVVRQTAEMIAAWQSVGFVHGVCNTDNFSILSITIDYGPFRFIDEYDPNMISNLSDDEGRYSYVRQPEVAFYNLNKLSEALAALLPTTQRSVLSQILNGFNETYTAAFLKRFRMKIGLLIGEERDDEDLILSLLSLMSKTRSDFTMTFRHLSESSVDYLLKEMIVEERWSLVKLKKHRKFKDWVRRYDSRLRRHNITEDERMKAMQQTNPRYVLRNWMAQLAIDATQQNDFSVIRRIARILERPFEKQTEAEEAGYADPTPDWASRLKISCSS